MALAESPCCLPLVWSFRLLRCTIAWILVRMGMYCMKVCNCRGLRLLVSAGLLMSCGALLADVNGWLNWRGPGQMGVSTETGLPDTWKPGGANHLWDVKLKGAGTPVIANGRLLAL